MIVTMTLNPAVDKTGIVERLTPGGVNRLLSVRQDPGGKGINVSKSLRSLGGESIALGILGGSTGTWIEEALSRLGIRTDFVKTDAPTRTNLKLYDAVVGDTTDINEPGQPCGEKSLLMTKEMLAQTLHTGDIAVLSGSLPPDVPKSTYADWTRLIRSIGAKAFVDADGESLRLATQAIPYAIKPNEHELSRLCGSLLKSIDELSREGLRLVQTGIHLVVVSLGARGAMFLSDTDRWYSPGVQVDAKSTVGAGDAMMAALAYGDHAGLPLYETAKIAIALSAASVMQTGTQGADPAEVKGLLSRVQMKKV